MLVGKLVALGLAVAALAAHAGAASHHHKAQHRKAPSRAARMQAALVVRVNTVRAAHGLSKLHVSLSLGSAAAAHSSEMAARGYFGHNSADGASFSQRIAHYYRPRGYRSWSVGENLAYGSPDLGALEALKLWLASPPHRANLLDPRWHDLGLSAVHAASAPGVFGHSAVTIVTADFGARSK
jgi:uncharacterized protein YkwD